MMHFPYKIIDLTHTLDKNAPSWEGDCGFKHEVEMDYEDCKTDVKFCVQQIKMHAGIGTHIDAPAHCVPGGTTVESLDLNKLIRPCVCIDVSEYAGASFSLSIDDILAFEKIHGSIAEGSFVIIYTGWDKYWHKPNEYRNNYQFPSVSEPAAKLLLERNIVGFGIDTLSPDLPSDGFPVHKLLLGSEKYIVENIACANQLPPVGSFIFIMPIKAQGLTEAPIRLISLINTE